MDQTCCSLVGLFMVLSPVVFVPFDLFSTSFLSLISFSTREIMNIQLYIVHQFFIFLFFVIN